MNSIQKKVSIAILFISSLALAQEETESIIKNKTFYYEQGLNTTQFIKQYLSLNTLSSSNIPYLLTGNVGYKRLGIRYGINYNYDYSKDNTPQNVNSSGSTINDSKSNNSQFDYRLGLYYSTNLSKHWRFLYGLDFLKSNSKQITSSNITTTDMSSAGIPNFTLNTTSDSKITTNTTGYGPFLSIQYFINANISIGTESSYYILSSQSSEKTTGTTVATSFGFNPQTTVSLTNFETSTKAMNTIFNVPLSIFVYFRF